MTVETAQNTHASDDYHKLCADLEHEYYDIPDGFRNWSFILSVAAQLCAMYPNAAPSLARDLNKDRRVVI